MTASHLGGCSLDRLVFEGLMTGVLFRASPSQFPDVPRISYVNYRDLSTETKGYVFLDDCGPFLDALAASAEEGWVDILEEFDGLAIRVLRRYGKVEILAEDNDFYDDLSVDEITSLVRDIYGNLSDEENLSLVRDISEEV